MNDSETAGEFEVVAHWEGFEPEAEEGPLTRAEALRAAKLRNMCRESERVWYGVRRVSKSSVESSS